MEKNESILVIFAWTVILLISDLPNILFVKVTGVEPIWLFWAKICVMVVALVLCSMLKTIRPLWQFAFVFLVFYLANFGVDWIFNSDFWQNRFYGETISYTASFISFHALDIVRAFLVITALWFVKRRWKDFYLVKGQTDAPIEPVRWLGIKQGESWRIFGWIFTICAAIGVAIPLALSVPLTAETFTRALPLLPVTILLAGLNAFAEETYYRASMLSTLTDVIGKNHALLLSCIFFGMAHYLYGSPSGIIGFALTGFLAFLLGKSMLETKGMLWAWVMHFVPDALIFFSYAMTWK